MSVLPVLEGRQLRLRAPTREDLSRLQRWYADPELVAPFDRFSSDSFTELALGVESAPSDPTSLAPRFMLERKSDRLAVGCVGHYRPHPVLEFVDVWYLIAEPSARGQGLGKEAVGLLVDHLFHTETLERVGATCDVENTASYRLVEGLGFRREGTMSSALFHHGRWHDVAFYGVTRPEWAARPRPS
ncbi:MAG: GNAT family N-acetyltransferase [Thermoplasmata archaeon]|nr:GNAT family N-acetyltransferase [Thermoplasmata archaeon]